MKKRYLTTIIQEMSFSDHKMALVSGPRQCGKTTLAKMLLQKRNSGAYFNWDDPVFRRAWVRDPKALVPTSATGAASLLALDEIHKDRRWKRTLKGVYDTLQTPCRTRGKHASGAVHAENL